MKSFVNKAALIGDKLLTVAASMLAVLMISYSAYAVEDSLLTQRNAFVGEDLLQYRPNVEAGEKVSFEGIRKVNPDVNSWLTVYGTNINYPVAQGPDDMHYSHTDLYGRQSLTGAIYLSALNGSGYGDQYNIIYGHHMDNGAMFGDVDNYLDASYMDAHRTGVLITLDHVYDIDIFASLETDAYESAVYDIEANNASGLGQVLSYLQSHATVYRNPKASNPTKLLILSTCLDTATSGRVVAVASLSLREDYDSSMFEALTGSETIEDDRTPLAGPKRNEWALLDVVCMLVMLYILLPYDALLAKFGRGTWIKRAQGESEKGTKDVRNYRKRMTITSAIELVLTGVAVAILVINESLFDPMTVIGTWTPLMIVLAAACWVVDVWGVDGEFPLMRKQASA